MNKRIGRAGALAIPLLTLCGFGFAAEPEPAAVPGLAFKVAKVVSMDDHDTVINNAILLVKAGKIEAIGPADQVKVPDGYRVLEFPEYWLVPGIVEAHNHASAGSMSDLNDMVYQTNPGLDTRSSALPDTEYIKQARTGGVTTTMMLPGSGTNLAGYGTVVSTGGKTPDEIVMRTPGSLKVAQAGNPEWYFGGNGRSFMNWNLRQTMEKAQRYCQAWKDFEQGKTTKKPEFNPIWDGFRGVFSGKVPVVVHTQWYQVLMTTLDMFTDKLKLWTVTDHSCFEAWKFGRVTSEMQNAYAADPEHHAPLFVIQGPRQYHPDWTCRRLVGNASGWWKNGVHILGINTDSPVIPQEQLTFQATMACWYGFLPYPALRGITNISAKSINVYNQVGSVESGKQADLSIWTGDPIDPRSACMMTVVNGKIVYDGTHGVRRF